MSDIVARYLALTSDPRRVVASPEARYFGYLFGDDTLVRLAPRASRTPASRSGTAAPRPGRSRHSSR